MRTNAIVRIVLYSLAILILLTILVGGLLLNTFIVNHDWEAFFVSENTGTLASAGYVSADEIKNIKIDWAAGSIAITPGDVDNILFSETQDLREEDRMVFSQQGDTLTIRFNSTRVYWGLSFDAPKDLLITVPRDWLCRELEIDAASASVHVTGLTVETVDFDGASGNFRFDDCHVGMLDVDTASGDVHFSGTLQELDCDAASASCTLVLDNAPRSIDADMASGDLRLTLPEDCGFAVKLDALSGDFTSDFLTSTQNGKYIYGDGRCRITISAMSGDIMIYKRSAAE